ncbi:MAG: ethylbenzene dehydrogenase-related protein [Alphaproteobacteria bacterium]
MAVAGPAGAVDWGGVQGKDIVVFYPGQSSWEWVLTESDHSGAPKFRGGKNCTDCHEGEQKKIGDLIASGKKLEPAPIPNKPGSLTVNVKAAHDDQKLYIRMEWAGGPPSGKKMETDFEEKATVMIDDGTVKEMTRAGCWGACHDDAIGMASAVAGKDLTKYLPESRSKLTRQGGGDSYKPQADLDALLQGGTFLEFWQGRLNKGKPAVPVEGYILDKRVESKTPAVTAEGGYEGDKWVVVLSRPLKAAGPGQKDIVAGKTYTLGFAIHDDYTEHRFHHVSLATTLVLDQGTADLVAVKK